MFRIGQEEIDAVTRVIESKQLFKVNGGPLQECAHLREELQQVFGTEHAIYMTSGHAALTSALIGMGIGPGDEVIVPGYTYIATAMAVVAAGAMPVIAEINETMTIDVADVERKITPRTKAVIPVHIQGFPSDMKGIMELAEKYNIMVLEDACQADGGKFGDKRLGTIGHAGALSFNFYKLITSGEGGALFTDDHTIYERALIYHDSSAVAFFGDQLSDVQTPVFCGHEFRTNEILASILRVQLSRMDGIIADNHKNRNKLVEALDGKFKIAPSNDWDGDCATTLALQFDTEEEARKVKAVVGGTIPIDTGKHVYPHWTAIMEKRGALHPAMDPFKMEANKDIVPDYKADMCPKTLDILARTLYVAIHPDMTEEDILQKAAALKAALEA